jgi:long-chain fatty acid transport protein
MSACRLNGPAGVEGHLMNCRLASNLALSLSLFLASAAKVHAGSVDNRNNNSVEFIRTTSRNAATQDADLAIYNPGGATRLRDGLHLSLSNQTIAKFNRHTLARPDVGYESDIVSPFYPTGFAVYKRDNWAAFAAFSFPGGGGELDYQKGSATSFPLQTNLSFMDPARNADTYLRSVYYGATLGGAWAPLEWMSVSLSVRALYARTDINVDAGSDLPPGNTDKIVDHMEEARGATGVLGVDFFPTKDWILALRYEGVTPLEWEVQKSSLNLDSVIKDPGTRAGYIGLLRRTLRAPGAQFQRDLPAVLGLGAAYLIRPDLRADLSCNYYFITATDWGGAEDLHDDGYEVSLSMEYDWAIPLRTSVGALYTVTGADSKTYQIENPALDSYTLGLGARYALSERFGISAGWAGNFALEDDVGVTSFNTTAHLEKRVLLYAVGVDYRLF